MLALVMYGPSAVARLELVTYVPSAVATLALVMQLVGILSVVIDESPAMECEAESEPLSTVTVIVVSAVKLDETTEP